MPSARPDRMSPDERDRAQWELHTYRYRVASRWTRYEDTVVDAACGIGYGADYLRGRWVGIDVEPPDVVGVGDGRHAIAWDLTRPFFPNFAFDVFVGLETIEHLDPLEHYVMLAKRARRSIVISTPIIPTVHFNPHHVHDFTRESLEALFVDSEWQVEHFEVQDDPVLRCPTYGIWAFGRSDEVAGLRDDGGG